MRTLLVHDAPEPCPYLPGQTARLPLHLPRERIDHATFDRLLEIGMRRSGRLLYRPQCPTCSACEAIRVPAAEFQPNRTQRKVLKRNDGELVQRVVAPQLTERHVELYNRHKLERGLSRTGEPSDLEDYKSFLFDTCVDTREVQYWLGEQLVGVSILDFGAEAVSGVYHFFDPDLEDRSIGVYAKLKEIELTYAEGRRWFYLGLYVAGCRSLAYKAGYHPHERRVNGVWTRFP